MWKEHSVWRSCGAYGWGWAFIWWPLLDSSIFILWQETLLEICNVTNCRSCTKPPMTGILLLLLPIDMKWKPCYQQRLSIVYDSDRLVHRPHVVAHSWKCGANLMWTFIQTSTFISNKRVRKSWAAHFETDPFLDVTGNLFTDLVNLVRPCTLCCIPWINPFLSHGHITGGQLFSSHWSLPPSNTAHSLQFYKIIAEKSPQQQCEGNTTMHAVINLWELLTKCQTITLHHK